MNCKYLVLGAGMSGLTTAYELSRFSNDSVIVLEKESTVGGLSRTIGVGGSFYDLGSHRIHPESEKTAFDLVKETAGDLLVKRIRRGKLRLKRSYIKYPIDSFQFLRGLGPIEAFLCAAALAKSRLVRRIFGAGMIHGENNYASYLTWKSGERAYRLFYEPYARKVWGCDPSTISLSSVKKRVSMTAPLSFLKAVMANLFRSESTSFFYYIEGGIGRLAERLEKRAAANRVLIITNVKNLDLSTDGHEKRAFYHQGGLERSIAYDTLISTIPLDELVAKLGSGGDTCPGSEGIWWRGLRLVYLHVEEEPPLAGETFYFPEKRYIFGRVSIPRRFSEHMQAGISSTCYVCEIPCTVGDALWEKTDNELYDLCLRGLKAAVLIGDDAVQSREHNFVIDIPKNYPLYTVGWEKDLRRVLGCLAERYPYVYSSGKLGLFLHYNIDHAIEIGARLAEHIREGRASRAWYDNVNLFQEFQTRD